MDKSMKKGIFICLMVQCLYSQSKISPADFWNSYSQEEKIAFINGAYGAVAKLKSHHKSEVKKQFMYDDNCLLYTSPSPRDKRQSRMPSSA